LILQPSLRFIRNPLPPARLFQQAFSCHSIIWQPRDTIGGDIYWLGNFENGSVLCVCDCMGHGLSGAMLAMLVAAFLDSIVTPENCHNTAEIMWQLEQRFVADLGVHTKSSDIHDGCDLAVLFIERGGSVSISSGNTSVFICDGTEALRLKGQRINIGEGRLSGASEIKTIFLTANENNSYYIASDGLFGQPGGTGQTPFGYGRFKEIILRHHSEGLDAVTSNVLTALAEHQGAEPRVDDIQLIAFNTRGAKR